MNSLASFQDDFLQAIFASPEAALPPGIAALVRQPGFAVYRNTVIKGCIDALQANYPAVTRLVGEEWFRAAAAVFVRNRAPTLPTLLYYGEGFADFLAEFEPAADLPYLPAVARIERLWTEAHAARDEGPLPAALIAELDGESLGRAVLIPHAAARWAWSGEHPAYSIWRRNRDQDEDLGDIAWQAEGVLITRPEGAVQWMELDAAGCAFMDACAEARSLAEATAAALAISPQIDLARLMAGLLQAGAFGGLQHN